MAGRGKTRNRKRPSRSKKTVPEKIAFLRKRCLEYLEEEVDIYLATPGNHAPIIRIAKALEELSPKDRTSGESSEAIASSAADRFFASFMEGEPELQAEADPSSEEEAEAGGVYLHVDGELPGDPN